MSIGKVAAGCAGFFLLLPGLCFFGVGFAGLFSKGGGVSMMIQFVIIGVAILGGAGLLIRTAFRPPELPLDESPNVVKIKRPTEEPPREP